MDVIQMYITYMKKTVAKTAYLVCQNGDSQSRTIECHSLVKMRVLELESGVAQKCVIISRVSYKRVSFINEVRL